MRKKSDKYYTIFELLDVKKADAGIQAVKIYLSRPSSWHTEPQELIIWHADRTFTVLKSAASRVLQDEDLLLDLYMKMVLKENCDA